MTGPPTGPPTAPGVVFVDDEADLRLAAEQSLSLADIPVTCLAAAEQALLHLSPDFAGVLVTDIRMPGMDGTALLDAALAHDPDLPVILVTGHGDVELAVSSMRRGAYDFIEKPYAPDRLIASVRRALEKRGLTLELRALRGGGSDATNDPIAARLIGRSQVMAQLRVRLRAAANSDTDILIEGETGTGKEAAARAVHEASARAGGPFVAIDCAALPEAQIESELFGHMQGAFPGAARTRYGKFEHARGGTLFLDQIESLPMPVQAKLLRAVQDRMIMPLGSNDPVPLDLRIIAATKDRLADRAAAGRFRDDLLYRLSVVTVTMPPLAARREDIPGLYQILLAQASARQGRPVPALSPQALADLATRDWPGNVLELRNAAERAILGVDSTQNTASPARLSDQMAAHERSLIAASLAAHNGSINATFAALGISRKALYDKMQKYGLDRRMFRTAPGVPKLDNSP